MVLRSMPYSTSKNLGTKRRVVPTKLRKVRPRKARLLKKKSNRAASTPFIPSEMKTQLTHLTKQMNEYGLSFPVLFLVLSIVVLTGFLINMSQRLGRLEQLFTQIR